MTEETVSLIPKKELSKGISIPVVHEAAAVSEKAFDSLAPDPNTVKNLSIPASTKEHIEKVRQDAAYRSGQAPKGVPVVEQTAGAEPVAVVMDPKNPLLSVYRELRAGIISLEECLAAVDAYVCSEEQLKYFMYTTKPENPEDLSKKENDIAMECARMSDHKRAEVMKDFYAGVQDLFKDYFKKLRKWEMENLSNLHTLRDIMSRVKDKNQIYASRVQAVIDTH